MLRKIEFTVVSSSSHEENFSAKELAVHAPTVSGWRSSRRCSYPQHVTIQLVDRFRVKKLQLLAHQFLIPAKVEFHIGDELPENSSSAPQLRGLGYASLSDNQWTGFKTRELMSVYVDAVGRYVKITLHKNHVNQYNHYNQVALVAINVLGDSVDGEAANMMPSGEQLMERYVGSSQRDAGLDATSSGPREFVSPLDDLAFDMYQDPDVARIIRLLDRKKQEVMQQEVMQQEVMQQEVMQRENQQHAKYLKQAIADLQKVGERLARYEVEKRSAMAKGDEELARRKEEVMEEYRRNVYQQLEVHNLLDSTAITRASDSPPDPLLPSPGPGPDPTQTPQSTDTVRKHLNTKVSRVSDGDGERPLPVHQRKGRPEVTPRLTETHSPKSDDTQRSPESSREPEALTENVQREAGLPVEVYGERLVSGVYSKSWSHRRDSLLAVYDRLLDLTPSIPRKDLRTTTRAAVFLLRKTLLDTASPVFKASLKVLRLLLVQLIPGLGLGRAETSYCLDQTLSNLLTRTGDQAGHLRAAAAAFIQELCVIPDVAVLQVIPAALVKPFRPSLPTRLALSRVELLDKVLTELGTENSGFTLDNVMTFLVAALEHGSPAVRELAVGVVLDMYRKHGAAAARFLPPNDADAAINAFLFKTLQLGFNKIDGKTPHTQTVKKGGVREDGEKEKEEIHSLQEQLAALKEITERGSDANEGIRPKREATKVESQKAAKTTKVQQNKVRDDVQPSINYLDNLCIFCGETDESFTEDGLDLHYWKHCPMLTRCDHCRQVVEISSLTDHLLTECESRSRFSRCVRCSEAVDSDQLQLHVQSSRCSPAGAACRDSAHCPLCHGNFLSGEKAWESHLMGSDGCKLNSRRIAVSQRTQPAQGLRQAWSVGGGARARGLRRGSRIPALARGQSPGKH